ncbi:MAG: S26 family signal peptidase [Polyangiaceae bacterium]|jgi:conjugative transfer signal peptidase TraF
MNLATSSRRGRTMSATDLSRLLLRLLGATAFASASACLLGSHLIWNWTPSLPLGLYWLSRGAPPPAALPGALVAFPVPGGVRDLVRQRRYLPPGAMLVKRVVAMPGDRVCAEGTTLTVNGDPLGTILTQDSAGQPLPHDEGCGPLPEGSVYVASHFAKSFDSRTFGPVRTSDIRGTVTPLWTY